MLIYEVGGGNQQKVCIARALALISMSNPVLMISGGVGIKNTVDLAGGIKYALDNIFNRSLYYVVYNMALIALVVCFASIIKKRKM